MKALLSPGKGPQQGMTPGKDGVLSRAAIFTSVCISSGICSITEVVVAAAATDDDDNDDDGDDDIVHSFRG